MRSGFITVFSGSCAGPSFAGSIPSRAAPAIIAEPGLLQQKLPDGLIYHEFRYNVVRTWERPADEILAGGLATLPLAPLARVKENELPTVIHAMQERLDREATKNQAETLWTATYILMGLKYSDELIDRLLEGVQDMKESVTYQKILREGRAEEAKRKRRGS